MRSICIISDTHGNIDNVKAILPVINESEYLVLLGDRVGDLASICREIKPEIIIVKGNCDYVNFFPEDYILDWCGYRFLFTHGHRYGVKRDLLNLTYAAKEQGCHFAFYGHTHVADSDEYMGIRLINPGSISAPRLGNPSYCLVTEDKGEIFIKIIYICPKNC